MRIFVLTKRRYMNKDLLEDRYGRFFELPKELAKLGHQVEGHCLSYYPASEGHLIDKTIDNVNVDWYSRNIGRLIFPGLLSYRSYLKNKCKKFKPDIIFACSDALNIIYGASVGRELNIPCIADLYDNFEAYGLTKFPGVRSCFKNAVKKASGIVCISHGLKKYVKENYDSIGLMKVITNGIPKEFFCPMERQQCRELLKLPQIGKLIGTAGALDSSRGIEILLTSAEELIAMDSSVYLVLAGRLGKGVNLPTNDNVLYLGEIPYDFMPSFFNALDIGVVCNIDTMFGRYCFPQKAVEMLSCGIPVVSANIGVMADIFFNNPDCLYQPGNQRSLVNALRKQLIAPDHVSIEIPSWESLAKQLEWFFLNVLAQR